MWLVTTQGFYSVVAHRDDPDTLIVRGRSRDDLEALRKQVPGLEPFEDPAADYRYRAYVSRAEWLAAVAQLTCDVDYDNFKSAVATRQGAARAQIYGSVWADLLALQDGRRGAPSRPESGAQP